MEAALRVSSSRYRFGRCVIDAAKRSLTRRGRSIEAEPRVFDLLLYLIGHHHRVVSVNEILEAVWGGVEVTASSVSQAVHKARIAIGDDGVTQRSIATVRGRGFRFVAPLLADGNGLMERARSDFVGREFELARLERAMGRSRRGKGGLLYLSGERGSGKTRIAQEVVARAPAHQMEAHLARCPEGVEPPAFWPWRQLARKLASLRTPAELEQLGKHRASELLWAERELLRTARAARARAPFDEQTRTRLFASATTGLARLAGERPLLLVLDDVHRADVGSLLFLRFLAHALLELPILIVATFREEELAAQQAKARLLSEAERAANGETLALEPLSPEETRQLAKQQLGKRVSERLLDALGALSGGNPLLLGELLRLSTGHGDAGIGAERPGALHLPRAMRAAVEQPLGRLRPYERRILRMAAVLGMEFELVPLAGAVASAPEKVFRSLVAAAAVHVVAPVAGKTHAFRFVHALVREALYEDLGPRERAHLHLRAALALEASSRSGPALLAHHFCEAAAVGGAERGVQTALQAARLSASRLDFERASQELQQAMRCLDFVPDVSPARRCEILVEAARVANQADPRRGGLLLSESARLARTLGDTAQRMLVAIAAAGAKMNADGTGMT